MESLGGLSQASASKGSDWRGTAGKGKEEDDIMKEVSSVRALFDLNPEMAALPRDHRGYPIPKFVAYIDGKPDFRVVDTKFWAAAVNKRLCYLCGGRLGARGWFVAGPMCTVTKTSSEPPCHRGCAYFAIRNCPFLTRPLAKRNDRDLPPEHSDPGGIMIARNPGVSAIYETRSYKIFRDPNGHPLIEMGPADDCTYWREGRPATREEVLHSIETGLPALVEIAAKQGPDSLAALSRTVAIYRTEILDRFLPPGEQANGQTEPNHAA